MSFLFVCHCITLGQLELNKLIIMELEGLVFSIFLSFNVRIMITLGLYM